MNERKKGKIKATHLEAIDLILEVIRQLSETVPVAALQTAQLALKHLFVQYLADTHTSSRRLVAVARANSLTCCTNLAPAKLGFFQSIDNRVQIEADVGPVGNENTASDILQSLLFKRRQFLEEAGNVDHGAGADEVDAFRRYEAGRKNVEVICHGIVNNCMAGIYLFIRVELADIHQVKTEDLEKLTVSAGRTATEYRILRQVVGNLSFACEDMELDNWAIEVELMHLTIYVSIVLTKKKKDQEAYPHPPIESLAR